MAVYGNALNIGQGQYRSAINVYKKSETETTYTYTVNIWGQLKNIDGWNGSEIQLGTWNGSDYNWETKASGNMYCNWSPDWRTTNWDLYYDITVSRDTNPKTIWHACDLQCGSGGWSRAEMSITIPAEGSAPTVTTGVVVNGATSVTVSGNANVTCDSWDYQLDGGAWVNFSNADGTSASKAITVTEATHNIKVRARKKTNKVYGTGSLVNIDTITPNVSAQFSNIGTDSFLLSASSNYNCNLWQYSLNNGATWTTFSNIDGTSASTTVSGLTVNTQYTVLIRARRTHNNLYSANISKTIKTQGGIAHLVVNNSFKDAIAYVKINSAFRQCICYTCVNGTWRIGT